MENKSLFCETVVDPATDERHGIEGNANEMFYFLLPNGQIIMPCRTCTDQLATGFKADGKTFRYATVASVRALAEFDIEFVTKLEINAGYCSFRACNCKLEAGEEMVLRNGEEYRRICNNDASALTIISTKAKEELALHESGVKKLGKRDRQTVERQAKLVPETMRAALKAIAALKEQARAKTEAAKQLARAQLGTAPVAKSAPVATPAKPVSAPKADHVLPADFGKKYRVLEVYGLDKGLLTEALQRAHAAKTSILDEVRKTKEGVAAIERRNAEVETERKLAALPADVVGRFKRPGSVTLHRNRTKGFVSARVYWFSKLADRLVKAAPVTTSKPAYAGNSGPLTQNPFAGLADAAAQTAQA